MVQPFLRSYDGGNGLPMKTDLLALLCALLMACTAAASTFTSSARSRPASAEWPVYLPVINWGSSG